MIEEAIQEAINQAKAGNKPGAKQRPRLVPSQPDG
jgi:hypothetical protein